MGPDWSGRIPHKSGDGAQILCPAGKDPLMAGVAPYLSPALRFYVVNDSAEMTCVVSEQSNSLIFYGIMAVVWEEDVGPDRVIA